MTTVLCKACGAPVEPELYNGVYGCDTGCEYIRFEIRCEKCGYEYEAGEFGWMGEGGEDCDEMMMEFLEQYVSD